MTCSHPNEMLEQVRRAEDGTMGLRCRACGFTAYAGDRLLRTLWNDVKRRVKIGRGGDRQ